MQKRFFFKPQDPCSRQPVSYPPFSPCPLTPSPNNNSCPVKKFASSAPLKESETICMLIKPYYSITRRHLQSLLPIHIQQRLIYSGTEEVRRGPAPGITPSNPGFRRTSFTGHTNNFLFNLVIYLYIKL